MAQMTVLFAGGGTGGHCFPNMSIAERLRELGVPVEPHFLVSTRPLDAKLMQKHGLSYTVLPVQPLTKKPWEMPGFLLAWMRSVRRVKQLIPARRVVAVVATGGFVSGPAIVAARKVRRPIPAALVNLDAVPGKANAAMARKATHLFTAYSVAGWPHAQRISVPLRRVALAESCGKRQPQAREALGLMPDRPTLLVCGGSQGAESINKMMTALVYRPAAAQALAGWQILHLAGERDLLTPRLAYERARISAQVLPFCDEMGLAWCAADLAISRAGASSVAEAWANAVPTLFLPYPYHADEHQRHNAQPLADTGTAIIVKDLIDGSANAQQIEPLLVELLNDPSRRQVASQRMRTSRPADGAMVVAQWIAQIVTSL